MVVMSSMLYITEHILTTKSSWLLQAASTIFFLVVFSRLFDRARKLVIM